MSLGDPPVMEIGEARQVRLVTACQEAAPKVPPTQVATTTRLPAAPAASHHRGASAMVTTPQTSWAAATTEKNARFWVLPRPTVAAAATLIAPAATLASAIADSTRAGFRSGSALG